MKVVFYLPTYFTCLYCFRLHFYTKYQIVYNMELVTQQKCDECMYLLHSKDGEREAWHYLLILYDKMLLIREHERGKNVDLKKCYRHIEYRNEKGTVKRASGFGRDPPVHISEWIKQNYGRISPATIYFSLIFTNSLDMEEFF